MPYRTSAELPPNVKDVLPKKAQDIWRKVFNNAMSPGVGGGSADEDGARKAAWAAVKNAGYVKDSDGNWKKKALGESITEILQDAKEGKRLNAAQMKRLRELYGILSEVVKWGNYEDNAPEKKKVKLDQENSDMAEDEKDIQEVVPVRVVGETEEYQYAGGALSFAEADEFGKTQKERWAIQDQLYEFEQIARNILDNDELDAKDKADKLMELSNDLPYRVANAPKLQTKSIVDKVKELFGSKAEKKTEDGQQFSASDYAYVPDSSKPSTWKLRLTESPGKLTVAQVGRAITALQPGGFRGQKVDIPSGDKPGVLSKISAAIGKVPGADDAQKKNLRDRLTKVGGKKEMDIESGFKTFVDNEGKTRWLSFSSNAFKDSEDEIFKLDALKEAVDYADKTGERGPLLVWHLPHTEIGECDFQNVFGRVLVESGTFLDTELGRKAEDYFKAHEGEDFGISIGYKYDRADREDGVYEWLRFKERSVTAIGKQANPWAKFSVSKIVSEVKNMSEKRDQLVNMFGEETADQIISKAEETSKVLEELGVETKSKGDEEKKGSEKKGAASEEKKDGEDKGEEKSAPDVSETIQALNQRLDFAGTVLKNIVERMDSTEKAIKELNKSDDEKVAEKIASAKSGVKSKVDDNSEDLGEDSEKVKEVKEGLEAEDNKSPADPHLNDFLRMIGVGQNESS